MRFIPHIVKCVPLLLYFKITQCIETSFQDWKELAKSWSRLTKVHRCPNPKLPSEMLSNIPTMQVAKVDLSSVLICSSLNAFKEFCCKHTVLCLPRQLRRCLLERASKNWFRRSTVMGQPSRCVWLMCFANLSFFSKWVYSFPTPPAPTLLPLHVFPPSPPKYNGRKYFVSDVIKILTEEVRTQGLILSSTSGRSFLSISRISFLHSPSISSLLDLVRGLF